MSEAFLKCIPYTVLLSLVLAWATLGCSASSSDDPFVGSWQCTGTRTLVVAERSTISKMGPFVASDVITDDGSGQVTIVHSEEGDAGAPSCTESWSLGGSGTTLTANAPIECATTRANITKTITTGACAMSPDGTTFTESASFTESGMTDSNQTYASSGASESTCTKM